MATVAGFLGIPTSGSLLARYMREMETVMRPIQLIKRKENEIDAVADENKAHIEYEDDKKDEYEIDGHEHPSIPSTDQVIIW